MSQVHNILSQVSNKDMSVKELAEVLNVSVAVVSGTMGNMLKQNLVEVVDGKVHITSTGKETIGVIESEGEVDKKDEVVTVVKTAKKTDIARAIFKEMFGKFARKDVIKEFITKADLTQQGAATYYYNFSKEAKQK